MDILYIIGIVCILIGAVLVALAKVNLDNVRDWLVWAVTTAEKDLGGGTGQLKLRQVYDAFVWRFPWVARFVSFARFGGMVDRALDEMKKMLQSNKAVKDFVEGGVEK